jgi:hypothetical protein
LVFSVLARLFSAHFAARTTGEREREQSNKTAKEEKGKAAIERGNKEKKREYQALRHRTGGGKVATSSV